MSSEPIGEFFSQAWRIYEKVVAADYLDHSRLYAGLTEGLRQRPGPLRLLELGCGDARLSHELLRQLPMEAYLGLDSSSFALQLARERLAGQACAWEVRLGDVRTTVAEAGGGWNVALASYCLHHLSPPEKRATLAAVREALTAPGVFVLVDVFLNDGETREEYLRRRHAGMRQWSALTPEEYEVVTEHERTSDFPETLADYQAWAREAGFSSCQSHLELSDGMHRWVTLET